MDAAAAVGAVSGSPGDGGSGAPTEQAAPQDPSAERKRKQKARSAKHYQARKAAVDRVAVLEALAEQGPLTLEQEAELAELRPKAQRKQKKKEKSAKRSREGRAAVDRVVDNTFTPSDASDTSDGSRQSDVDSVFPVGPVDSAAVPVPSGKGPVVSAVVDGKDGKDVQGGKEGAGGGGRAGAGGSVRGGDAMGGRLLPIVLRSWRRWRSRGR
nr:hypothetical protein [Saccharopolyspora spinosa]